MMDCQVCVRGKLLLPVEEYSWFSFGAGGKVVGCKQTKLGISEAEAPSENTPLIVSAVIKKLFVLCQ